jgi:thiol-disulfide isomerase/thioredoxin
MGLKAIFKCGLFCAFAFSANSQPLTIGQSMPGIELSNILNYEADKLNMSDFKGKLVILDFWNHHCIPCFASFPKLDSLQKKFKDEIQIMLVNSESRDSTISFFKKRPKIKRPSLIMITGDRTLRELFPTEGYPYCVWIDSLGVIRKFSGAPELTAQSISNFMAGNDKYTRDPTRKQAGSPINLMNFKYVSYIGLYSDTVSIGNSERQYSDDSSYLYAASNGASIEELFKKAYGEKGKYNFHTRYGFKLLVSDSSAYIRPADRALFYDWSTRYGYNYELYLPASKASVFYKIMQEDLQRCFPVEASIKIKKIKSIVVKSVDPKRIKTQGGEVIDSLGGVEYGMQPSGLYRRFQNQPYSLLSTYLRLWIQYYYPFYDEVQLPYNIDITIREESVNPINIDNLLEDLGNAGFVIVFEEKACPVLYLRQIP